MKRLAYALLISSAIASSAFALTPLERERNSFDYVSTPPHAEPAATPAAGTYGTASQGGYNKAVEEHKAHQQKAAKHTKRGKKAQHKKAAKKPAEKTSDKPAQ